MGMLERLVRMAFRAVRKAKEEQIPVGEDQCVIGASWWGRLSSDGQSGLKATVARVNKRVLSTLWYALSFIRHGTLHSTVIGRLRTAGPTNPGAFKKYRKIIIFLVGTTAISLSGWLLLPTPPPPLAHTSFSKRITDPKGHTLHVTLTPDDKYRIYTHLGDISPDLVAATVCYEDQHFWQHPGINPLALFRSSLRFCRTGKSYAGASTISMQLARMSYGIKSRTLSGKILQIYRALQLERHYSKAQILEAYLNLAPYGHNIEGIGAASTLYFEKPAAQLTLYEAVVLSVIPQNPGCRCSAKGQGSRALEAAEVRVLQRLGKIQTAGEWSSQDFSTPLMLHRSTTAPHFVRAVLKTSSGGTDVTSTLDADLQRLVEKRIAAYVETKGRLGVSNAAAMLVDTRSMEVLAQVGSAGFFNEKILGQVDGTLSRRSPGSTLKPFIYALAMDQGLIQPLSILKDTPQRFAGYSPENFDGQFAGPITACDALVRSRNVPAVWLASQLSRPSLYQLLVKAGVKLLHDESYYGLALPLGGGEVTMEELVRLYAALANGGRLRQLCRTFPHPNGDRGLRLFSPEAAFLTLDMLTHNPRPGLNDDTGSDGIAWKTGTSHGFRDAWSVAVFDHYVLAVWLGNFDGRPNPAFVGRSCAAPLLFQMIDSLRTEGRAHLAPILPPEGANLRRVELCAISGQIPTDCCTHRKSGWFIPGVSPISACEVHREILVDVQTGLRVPVDDGTRQVRREVYEFWPSDLMSLFEKAGLPRRCPPPFIPDTTGGMEMIARHGKAPQILSPQANQTYAVRAAASGNTESAIPLRAQAESDVARLYWFADRAFLGTTSAREALSWRPAPGLYRVVALDDHGRSSVCVARVDGTGGW